MLELYHGEPTGASARVLIALEEKGLEFRGHYVDVLALEQYRLPLESLSPGGDLPVLIRDGVICIGTSGVCELLEEAYPERPLMPPAPRDRWSVRVWQKHVDDILAPAASELAWRAFGQQTLGAGTRGRLEREVEHIVPPDERTRWRAALAGYGEEQLARARTHVQGTVARVEAALGAGPWIAGQAYTLADIAVFSYLNYFPALGARARLGKFDAPRVHAWLSAVSERPAVRGALARGRGGDPFATAIPAPEQIRWG